MTTQAMPGLPSATVFRCGGCGTAIQFGHGQEHYGRLVRGFLDQHGGCGNAVEITAGRRPHDPICG